MDCVSRKRAVIPCLLRDLCFVHVEVKRGIGLRLTQEKFFHPRFVIGWLVGLRLIISESFSQARAAPLLVFSEIAEVVHAFCPVLTVRG